MSPDGAAGLEAADSLSRRINDATIKGRYDLLFSDRSLWTMLHGLLLSGGALMLLVAALFSLRAMALPEGTAIPVRQSNAFAGLTVAIAVLLWMSVLGGTYIVFPRAHAAGMSSHAHRQ